MGRPNATKGAELLARPLNHEGGVNPYVAGRQEYDTRFGDLAKGKRKWQGFAFAELVVILGLCGEIAWLAAQSKVMPYVVEVDALGAVRSVGLANRMPDPSDAMVKSQLVKFVTNLRSVYADPVAERQLISDAYAYVSRDAEQKLNAYFGQKDNNPAVLGKDRTRLVEVTSVLQDPKSKSWNVRWRETEILTGSTTATVTDWEAVVSVVLVPPKDESTALHNPLGLYITNIDWNKESDSRGVSLPGVSQQVTGDQPVGPAASPPAPPAGATNDLSTPVRP